MENKSQKKYNFVSQVLILFAADVLMLMIISYVIGDSAKVVSDMYQLGSKGLALSTLLQFFLNSVIIITLKTLYFSEKLFKKLMSLWKVILMLFSVLVVSVTFIIVFHWFPLNNIYAWTGFILCFAVCFVASSLFMVIKTRLTNKKYNELLSSYKNEHGGNNDNESY